MAGPGDRRSYQSPEAVLAEARRMAAEIRRQAEREAAVLRRDAAEWASSIRRQAEQRAQVPSPAPAAPSVAPDASPVASPVVDLTAADEVVDLRQPPPPGLAPAIDPAELEAALRGLLPAPMPSPPAAGERRPTVRDRPVTAPTPVDDAGDARHEGDGRAGVATVGPGFDPAGVARPAATTASAPDGKVPADLDPYDIGRSAALGAWMDAAAFRGPSRPTGVAADRPDRRNGDVIDLGRVVEARRRAEERRIEAAERAEQRAREGFRPVETSIETRVHDIVRQAVRRTFTRRSS